MSNRDHKPFFIVTTIILAAALGMLLVTGVEKPEARQSEVGPPALNESPRGSTYEVAIGSSSTISATDFYDNHGRLCTAIDRGGRVALDCDLPRQP